MSHPTDNDPDFQKEQRAFVLYQDGIAQWLVVIQSNVCWCDFAIYREFEDGTDEPLMLFRPKHWQGSGDEEPWSNDAESTMEGHVKWDGCTEFKASDHFCDGADSYQELSDVIQETMAAAHLLMCEVSRARGKESNLDWDAPPAERLQRFTRKPVELPEKWDPNHQTGATTNA